MTEATAEPTWVCVGCRARVPMAEDVCTTCGRPFGEGLGDHEVREQTKRELTRWGWALKEFVILNVLFVIWRIVGQVSLFHEAGAVARGKWLWHAERVLRLPSEADLQRPILGHATFDRIANGYYAWAHIAVFAAMLLWLLVWKRADYPKWRNLVVAFTGVSLLIGLMPTAPPRLIPSLGMVDLPARYGQSVYGGLGKGITDQLSAMPSVHVGWAVLVAWAVIAVSKSRWRWLVLAHPILTTYFIVVTANHYWLDGVAALVLLGLIYAGLHRWWPSKVP
ncbi:MAG TPA: phosphatase PAP2 family protein [Mycobacteriales bacterium]|nr:phosphatase PAP2 family protein [Mycobacteriales bacterium]